MGFFFLLGQYLWTNYSLFYGYPTEIIDLNDLGYGAHNRFGDEAIRKSDLEFESMLSSTKLFINYLFPNMHTIILQLGQVPRASVLTRKTIEFAKVKA